MKGRENTFVFRCRRCRQPAVFYSISIWIKLASEVIVNGWEAHFSVLDMELDCFGKDVDGVLQMMIKPCEPCVGNLSPGLWNGMCVII